MHPLASPGGAGSLNGLSEGMYCVGCCRLIVSPAPCRGRQLGDPKPTQLRSSLNGNDQRLLSSWLPPGGSQEEVAVADSIQRPPLFRKLRVARLATPTMAVQDHGHIQFIVLPPQPRCALQHPRGGAKAAAPQRVARLATPTDTPKTHRCLQKGFL